MRWFRRDRPLAPAPSGPPPPTSHRGRAGPERLTTLNVERFLRDHGHAVVDVWAPWCGPCRAFGPVFERAAERWSDRIGFGKLHADHEPTLVRRFRVRSIPTLLFFRDGRLARTQVGAVGSDRFEAQLRLAFRDLPWNDGDEA